MYLTIYGNPVAQGRPRFARRGKFVTTYDPEKSRSWKETVKWQVLAQGVPEPLDGPLVMSLIFMLPRPASLPKKVIEHTKKPDWENLAKAICDALEGICYKNDSQIVECNVKKIYAERTGVQIGIKPKRRRLCYETNYWVTGIMYLTVVDHFLFCWPSPQASWGCTYLFRSYRV